MFLGEGSISDTQTKKMKRPISNLGLAAHILRAHFCQARLERKLQTHLHCLI